MIVFATCAGVWQLCDLFCADFAAALANPIAYQSQLEKHAQQLAILEDFDTEVRKTGNWREIITSQWIFRAVLPFIFTYIALDVVSRRIHANMYCSWLDFL